MPLKKSMTGFVLLVALIAGGFSWLRSTPHADPVGSATEVGPAAAPTSNFKEGKPDLAQPLPKADLAQEKIANVTSLLKKVSSLSSKALRTQQEERELEDLLANQKNLDQVFLYLNARQALDPKRINETMRVRMAAVDYFAQAAEWKTNPIRDDVVASVQALLINDNLDQLADDEARKAVIGDQVELYTVLKSASPATANSLAHLSRGTRLAKIIALADGLYSKHSARKEM